MKKYRRIEQRFTNAKQITEVTEKEYITYCEWDDGEITSRVKFPLSQMGWNSLDEFLKDKKHSKKFVLVEN